MEIKKLPNSQAEIVTEIPAEEFDRFFEAAVKNIQKNLELPGFRRGMAPTNIVKERVGLAHILEEAAEAALKTHWPNIIKESGFEPVGHPEISITKLAEHNPLGLKIVISLMPEIILPDYKKIAKDTLAEKKEVTVSAEELERTLNLVRDQMARSENGKEIKIDENTVKENLRLEKERKAKNNKRIEILERISKELNVFEMPEVLLGAELEKMLLELKANLSDIGLALDKYIEHLKNDQIKGEEDLKKSWKEDARHRVIFGLILSNIAKQEGLKPLDEALSNEIEKILKNYGPEDLKKIDKKELEGYIYGQLQNEMVFNLLENNS